MTIRFLVLTGAALSVLAPNSALAQTDARRSTDISGRVFYNLSDKGDGAEFDLKRFYLAVDHRFTDSLSANLTTDVQYSTRDDASDAFVKKAYLQAKVSDALTVRAGAADTPWIAYVDGLYGYRWIEKTLIDRTAFGQSSDWGVHTLGSFKDGAISYAVSALDGGGHRDPSSGNSVDVEGRLGARIGDIELGAGGYRGTRGAALPGRPALRTARRINVAIAYTPGAHRIGVEAFAAENWNSVLAAAADRSRGYSAFGSYAFSSEISVFTRYDRVRPTRSTAPAREEVYFNAGAAYAPVRNVDVALVYKRKVVDNAAGARTAADEVGVWGQLRF